MHCDEYAVALRNMSLGIMPPWSGRFDNAYTCGMGAAIRSELWACLAPGNPDLAAQWAREDASIDHCGDGVDAEVFLSALEAMAFTETDIELLIEKALSYLPEDSNLRTSMSDTVKLYKEHREWLTVRNILMEKYAPENATSVRINLPFIVLALLHGNGDFGKTICTAVNCGMDTDCTGATTGAILGIMSPECIDEKWIRPIGRGITVRPSCVPDLTTPKDVDGLCDVIESLKKKLSPVFQPAPEIPEPDYSRFFRTVEVAVQRNPQWYWVHTDQLSWQSIQVPPINGEFKLPCENKGDLQIVLRFRFSIEEEAKYAVMFVSDSSNQCYLDPETEFLHDSVNMTFGRMRLWKELPDLHGEYRCAGRPLIWAPTLGGAPLNQIKRHVPLKKGEHVLYAVLEPQQEEEKVRWGFGVGLMKKSAFLNDFMGKEK